MKENKDSIIIKLAETDEELCVCIVLHRWMQKAMESGTPVSIVRMIKKRK